MDQVTETYYGIARERYKAAKAGLIEAEKLLADAELTVLKEMFGGLPPGTLLTMGRRRYETNVMAITGFDIRYSDIEQREIAGVEGRAVKCRIKDDSAEPNILVPRGYKVFIPFREAVEMKQV